MRKLLIFGALLLAPALHAQDVAGDWTGALNAGGATLRLVLHVTKTADGALSATMDSVDQNAFGIPVKSVTVDGRKLSLDVAAVHGAYAGTISADGKSIDGTWTQGSSLPLTFTRAAAKVETKPAAPSDIDGAWSGALDTGTAKLRLVFHILNTPDGLKATIDSVDQGANGIPVAAVTRDGAAIRFDAPVIGGRYEAKIAGDRMTGTWSQNGHSLPLALQRVKNASELQPHRPQEPKPPYPYDTRDVQFANGAIALAGTLTMPRGAGPFPAVVLIAGSGPHDRDEPVMGHRPFLVLADALTRRGIAVLRYDKRGVGKSGGVYATATTHDFASDAAAAFTFLETVPHVSRAGLLGHSEGGLIAPIVAAQHRDVAFIVLLAAPGVRGDKILIDQTRLIAQADGATAEEANRAADEARAKLPELTSPWFREFLAYDPAPVLHDVKCPILALAGSKDLQVPATENLAAIRRANPNAEVHELPGLNHLFQHARSGSPLEYASIDETMAPEVMETIAGWIRGERASGPDRRSALRSIMRR